jgi:hsp70-interacting protein
MRFIQSTKTSLFHLLSYVILSVQVLLAIKSLLKLSSTDVEDFEFYDLDSVLLRLGVQLEDLTPEDQKEFAVEVDALRREVQTLFQQKLKQAHS